jgi:hypothetical protein
MSLRIAYSRKAKTPGKNACRGLMFPREAQISSVGLRVVHTRKR